MSLSWKGLLLAAVVIAPALFAQDVMVLTDGERLVGKFESSSGASAKFKSDIVGEVTVDWSKVSELQTKEAFAVIPKNVKVTRKIEPSKVPQGNITVADQKITVTPAAGPPQTIAVGDATNVIPETAFQNAIQHAPNFFSDWGGTITGGGSLVQATQQSRMVNAAIHLVRISPDEDWLPRSNQTSFDFTTSYGTLTQPGVPTIKTDLLHAAAQRDEYFSSSLYGFGEALFDHNYSQGLDLQQTYGGGIGWSIIHRPNESLDLKAGVTYIRQSFAIASADHNLVGSTFEQDFTRGLRRGIKFNEQLIVTPAWNIASAWSAVGNANLSVPVYKRFNFTVGTLDNYLNDPPPLYKKNSFQATMGLTYSLR